MNFINAEIESYYIVIMVNSNIDLDLTNKV